MLQPTTDNEKKKQKKKKGDNQDKLCLFTIHLILLFLFDFILATLISAVGMNAKPKIIDLTKKIWYC